MNKKYFEILLGVFCLTISPMTMASNQTFHMVGKDVEKKRTIHIIEGRVGNKQKIAFCLDGTTDKWAGVLVKQPSGQYSGFVLDNDGREKKPISAVKKARNVYAFTVGDEGNKKVYEYNVSSISEEETGSID